MFESVLLTGGTGKTGSRIAAQLATRNVRTRIASRHPQTGQTFFDWLDPSTFASALENMESVYLLAPKGVADCLTVMRPFIEQALEAGIRRLVFLSSSLVPEAAPALGQVHQYLHQHAPSWVVLRPSWFMQNFSEQQHRETIRQHGAIFSATGDGKVPFIDAGDIAAVAAEALTDQAFPSGETVLTGPGLLSYSDVATILTSVVGYPVRHQPLTEEELARNFEKGGIPREFAVLLASLDRAIANGAEARLTTEVERITGRPPVSFQTFAENTRSAWRRS
jgi:ergot alkaloid biosynthesis protein